MFPFTTHHALRSKPFRGPVVSHTVKTLRRGAGCVPRTMAVDEKGRQVPMVAGAPGAVKLQLTGSIVADMEPEQRSIKLSRPNA